MKKMFTTAMVVMLIAAVGVLQVVTEQNAFAASGKSLYKSKCQSCHGTKGGGASGPDIRSESFNSFKKAVKSGKEGMPAFKSLSSTTIKKIWKFVHI
ncbi:MAG: c-type cytochrome [Candidatus Schekmanbacteria bacterium]|nr:c-type cytochrome [Candidatus Schekmanbacteria bacterium]